MHILAPSVNGQLSWQDQIRLVREESVLQTFSDEAITFLDQLSKDILRDRSMRKYPELMACAHWFRKSHLMEMKLQFEQHKQERIWKARGTVLHFAPSNVDTIFLYSWILSLLMGNRNILRISRKQNDQMKVIIDKLNDMFEQEGYRHIAKRNLFVSYDHEEDITTCLSQYCDIRVIWGGDYTVQSIRRIPLPPGSIEMVFPDRHSLAVLHSAEVCSAHDHTIHELAKQFYNDAYWFGQMACSSPREIYWIGTDLINEQARKRFWSALEQVLQAEGYRNSVATDMLRLATAQFFATKDHVKKVSVPVPHRSIHIEVDDQYVRDDQCGGGFFIERSLDHLMKVALYLNRKDQTVSYYGFHREELLEFVGNIHSGAVDRIVPIGQALAFNAVWDGYDFFRSFTREITVIS